MPPPIEGLSQKPNDPLSTRWLAIALVVIVGSLLYLGLTPFIFRPPNAVLWSVKPPGLVFEGSGLAFSANRFSWPTAPPAEITVHLWLEPASEPQAGLGSILSLDDDHRQPRLLLAQWRDWLILRVRSEPTAKQSRGYWEIGAEFALPVGHPRLLTLTSGSATGTSLYVNGVLRSHDLRSIFGTNPPPSGRWVLGSAPTGNAGWMGRLQSFLAYPRALSAEQIAFDAERLREEGALSPRADSMQIYEFAGPAAYDVRNQASGGHDLGPLSIPETFDPPSRTVLQLPSRDAFGKDWFYWDAVRNLIGFVPLGCLLAYARGRSQEDGSEMGTLILAITLGGGLSAGLELTQAFQPARVSSLVDLALNTSGTAIGAYAALTALRRNRRKNSAA